MFGEKQNTKACLIMLACLLVPCLAIASPQRVVIHENGDAHTIGDNSAQNLAKIACKNIEGNIMASKLDDLPPNIMATINVEQGTQKSFYRIFDVVKSVLSPGHDISKMKVGCLTREGGVGIDLPHQIYSQFNLKIQIDAEGRVFLGYDQTGLDLISP